MIHVPDELVHATLEERRRAMEASVRAAAAALDVRGSRFEVRRRRPEPGVRAAAPATSDLPVSEAPS